jgi:hypothetical protein
MNKSATPLLLRLVGALSGAAGLWELFQVNSGPAVAGLLCCGVLLLLSDRHALESIKLPGANIKLKQLDDTLLEADVALKRIRALAEMTSASLILAATRIGRWDSALNAREMASQVDSVRAILTDLHSSNEVIRTAIQPWIELTVRDMAGFIALPTIKLLRERIVQLEEALSLQFAKKIESDPELNVIQEKITQTKSIADRLNNYRLFAAAEYPECVLRDISKLKDCEPKLFENLQPSIEVWTERIRHFKGSGELFDNERWFEIAERSARGIPFDLIQ